MERLSSKQFHWMLTLIGVLFFIPFLGGVHLFDWDEINFAESAREMIVSGNFWQVQVNFEPFWEKPPLFLWIQALSMKIFGVNEFAARLPNALIGIISINLLYKIGRELASEQTGRWWALVYLGSFMPHFYFHTGIIDPLFNLFIFLSVIALYRAYKHPQLKSWMFAGVFLGLAVLTKGPVAGVVVAFVLLAFWVRNKLSFWFTALQFITFSISTLAVASLWFLPEILTNGIGFLSNFLAYQLDLMQNPVASHGQPWYYHSVVLLIGCFPASVLALTLLVKPSEKGSLEFWMKAMFWTVLILFSVVTTKIVHYSSLCYFPLTFLAAKRLTSWSSGAVLNRTEKGLLALLSVFWFLIFLAVPTLGFYREKLVVQYAHLIKDSFTLGNLSQQVNWSIGHVLLGLASALILFWVLSVLFLNKRLSGGKSLVALAVYFVLFIALVVPNVEQHTQGGSIEFYESIEGENVYVDTYKYKSYGQFFYTKIQPLEEEDALLSVHRKILDSLGVETRLELDERGRFEYSRREMQWFLYGKIDKPVYLVSHPRKAHELESTEGFKRVYEKGGFVAFRRDPIN